MVSEERVTLPSCFLAEKGERNVSGSFSSCETTSGKLSTYELTVLVQRRLPTLLSPVGFRLRDEEHLPRQLVGEDAAVGGVVSTRGVVSEKDERRGSGSG